MTQPPPNASRCTSSVVFEHLLSENPQLGYPGRVPGTRELVIPKTPFVVPYPRSQQCARNLARIPPRPPLAGALLAASLVANIAKVYLCRKRYGTSANFAIHSEFVEFRAQSPV